LYVILLVFLMEIKIFQKDLRNLGTEATSEIGTWTHRLDYIFWFIILLVKTASGK